jgi:hypothetical protein
MGNIYRGSTLAIVAVSGKHAQERLFQHRNPLRHSFCCITVSDDSRLEVYLDPTLYPGIQLRHFSKSSHTSMTHAAISRLLQRAWVVQERYLSPRILAYYGETFSWMCAEGRCAEYMNMAMRPLERYEHEIMNNLFGTGFRRWPVRDAEDDDSFIWSRHKLIIDFTNCQLMYPTNRLPAILGLLNVVQRHTGLDNACGLWQNYLSEELLWYVRQPATRRLGNGQLT